MKYGEKDEKNRYVRNTSPQVSAKPKGPGGVSMHRKVLLFTLAAVVLVGGTLAFLHVITVTATNPFTFGNASITIEEEFDNWDMKKVFLTNDDLEENVPGVVRAMIVPVLKDATTGDGLGGTLQALSEPVDNKMVVGDFTFQFASDWASNWFYQDGYFYYRKVLEPGETSTQLLQKVTLTNDTQEKRKEYENVTVEVEVLADILQAEGGAAAEAWGITVSGSAVSP